MITQKVYTYYQQIDVINNDPRRKSSQNDLINICKKSWELNGWELHILSYDNAKEHPFYHEYSSIIKQLPSVNPESYDYHCYMRWLAMAQIGGGVMIDYDVVNMSLKSDEIFTQQHLLSIFQTNVPCVVHGSAAQYLGACKAFCQLQHCISIANNKPHVSDMIMIMCGFNDSNLYNKISYVVDYPYMAPLIHCSQHHCKKNNMTKLEAMQNLVKQIYEI